jgi:hypothetical protein
MRTAERQMARYAAASPNILGSYGSKYRFAAPGERFAVPGSSASPDPVIALRAATPFCSSV